MGVHFTLVFNHDLAAADLDVVRARFGTLDDAFSEVAAFWSLPAERQGPYRNGWLDASRPDNLRTRHFYAPAGFSLVLGPAAGTLHHVCRFGEFVEGGPACELLRRFSRCVAAVFGLSEVLYAPCEGIGDEIADWVYDGLRLEDMKERLAVRQPPPASLAELAAHSGPALQYFVDRFDDRSPAWHSL